MSPRPTSNCSALDENLAIAQQTTNSLGAKPDVVQPASRRRRRVQAGNSFCRCRAGLCRRHHYRGAASNRHPGKPNPRLAWIQPRPGHPAAGGVCRPSPMPEVPPGLPSEFLERRPGHSPSHATAPVSQCSGGRGDGQLLSAHYVDRPFWRGEPGVGSIDRRHGWRLVSFWRATWRARSSRADSSRPSCTRPGLRGTRRRASA